MALRSATTVSCPTTKRRAQNLRPGASGTDPPFKVGYRRLEQGHAPINSPRPASGTDRLNNRRRRPPGGLGPHQARRTNGLGDAIGSIHYAPHAGPTGGTEHLVSRACAYFLHFLDGPTCHDLELNFGMESTPPDRS